MILPDLLRENLKVVFCGTAVGNKSKVRSAYYADSRNKFYKILHKVSLTPVQIMAKNYSTLLEFNIGLTDLVKNQSGVDRLIKKASYDVEGLRNKILNFKPEFLCFNGKRAAKVFYKKKTVEFGLQAESIGSTVVFIVPSTSGTASKYWDESFWIELSNKIK